MAAGSALRWTGVERERARLVLATSYVVRSGQRQLNSTKTDEDRRLSLDTVTLQLLADFRAAREAALAPGHLTLSPASVMGDYDGLRTFERV